MNTTSLPEFAIIGIALRTTNENGQSAKDIPLLWQKFMTESISEQIPNKISTAIYCMYTEYETDHTKPYTTILGCKVENLDNIPLGMVGKKIPATDYQKFIAKGNLQDGIVYQEWLKIWEQTTLNRKFTSDFEIYGEKALNPNDAEVEIFIAI